MNIAIIGAGVSGLTAARILCRHHNVAVFEADDRVGGHANTVVVNEGERKLPIDTGFIVFNEPNYPNLCRLFDLLQVEHEDSDMSFSVHCEQTGLEYNGSSLNTLFAQRRNMLRPGFWSMLSDIFRFHREAAQIIAEDMDDRTTVRQYVNQKKFGRTFVEHYLLPLGASLWSCDARQFESFPMRFVVEFLRNHRMLQTNGRPQWKTVKNGSFSYVQSLIGPFKNRIYASTPIRCVRRRPRGVEVVTRSGARQDFDEVIMATHADQALRIVENPEPDEHELLRYFPYQKNEAVLHTDTDLLPERKTTWGSWNYRIPKTMNGHVTVTYNMNRLQNIDSERTYCVSLNQTGRILRERVLSRIQYEHPLFVPGRCAAQARHAQLVRRRGISYCGAYWGFGFHEDGVRSAMDVCDAFSLGLDE